MEGVRAARGSASQQNFNLGTLSTTLWVVTGRDRVAKTLMVTPKYLMACVTVQWSSQGYMARFDGSPWKEELGLRYWCFIIHHHTPPNRPQMRPTVAITIPHELDDNHQVTLESGGAEGQPAFGFCPGCTCSQDQGLANPGCKRWR